MPFAHTEKGEPIDMGVYIDMEKPKICMDDGNCLSCPMHRLWCGMRFAPKGYTCGQTFADMDGKVPKWCPMIEIDLVRCGECARRKKNGFCLEHNRYERNDDGFCNYGERRADD